MLLSDFKISIFVLDFHALNVYKIVILNGLFSK